MQVHTESVPNINCAAVEASPLSREHDRPAVTSTLQVNVMLQVLVRVREEKWVFSD